MLPGYCCTRRSNELSSPSVMTISVFIWGAQNLGDDQPHESSNEPSSPNGSRKSRRSGKGGCLTECHSAKSTVGRKNFRRARPARRVLPPGQCPHDLLGAVSVPRGG